MNLMANCLFVIAFAISTISCEKNDANSAPDPTNQQNLEGIIAQNTDALGGAAALDAIVSMKKRSNILEGQYDDETVFVVDRLGRMRVDIFADGARVFAESYDGQNGYQWRPGDGQSPASERGTEALSHTAQLPNHVLRLKDLAANGHEIVFLETETIDGADYYVLQLTLSDGFKTYLFMDQQTGYVTRARNERALHVDVDDEIRVIEARMSDFRRVGDIFHPFKVEEYDLGKDEKLVDITLRSVILNVDAEDDYFTDLENTVPALD